MGGLKVCFFSIVVLVAWLCSSCANPAPAIQIRQVLRFYEGSEYFGQSNSEYDENLARDPNQHIHYRLERYFIFGAILRFVTDINGRKPGRLVKDGPIQYQYPSSDEHGYQAAHVIRVGQIDTTLEVADGLLYKALKKYIDNTQKVKTGANDWSGVGGAIDRFQSNNLNRLASIDFTLTSEDRLRAVEQLQQAFYDTIRPFVMKPEDNNIPTGHRVLQHDWFEVYRVSPEQLLDASENADHCAALWYTLKRDENKKDA